MMLDVTDSDFEQKILKGQGVNVVFCSADWCSYCKMLEPTVKQIAEEKNDKMHMYYCDVDKTRNHISNYQLQGVPTLLLFKDGQPVGSLVGAQPKNVIDNWISGHL